MTTPRFFRLLLWVHWRSFLARLRGLRREAPLLPAVLAAFVLCYLAVGYWLFRWKERSHKRAVELQQLTRIEAARREAEAIAREAKLKANEDALKVREETEQSFSARRKELTDRGSGQAA